MNDSKSKWAAYDEMFQRAIEHTIIRMRTDARDARREPLNPAEQAEEDRRIEQIAVYEVMQVVSRAFVDMGDPVLHRDSWTIDDFSWLLLARNPRMRDAPGFLDDRRAVRNHKEICEVLESCVGVKLTPIYPMTRPADQRFRITDLIDVAEAKRLGFARFLRAILQDPNLPFRTVPAPHAAQPELSNKRPAPQSLAAAGTAAREEAPVRRRRQLVEFARELVAARVGTESSGLIELSINAQEFNKRFQAKYSQWRTIKPRTFERDRDECFPRIQVLMGRPAKEPE